jgi:hypothetical protein
MTLKQKIEKALNWIITIATALTVFLKDIL